MKVRECLVISEFYLPCVENCLTAGAVVPFVGSLPAAAKVALGLIQVIAGIALSIFSALKDNIYGYDEYSSLSKFGPRHIVHGLTNMSVGISEGLPIFGTFVVTMKFIYWNRYAIKRCLIHPLIAGQHAKLLPYQEVTDYLNIENGFFSEFSYEKIKDYLIERAAINEQKKGYDKPKWSFVEDYALLHIQASEE